MVIAVRRDLRLDKGKLAVQVAHAAVSLTMKTKEQQAFRDWFANGQKKICVAVPNETSLLDLKNKAEQAGLPTTLVRDAGRTQLAAGTITCLGIGPAQIPAFEHLTATLPLL